MCDSKANGGRRCAGHLKKRISTFSALLAEAKEEDKAALTEKVKEAQREYDKTRSGVQEFIASNESPQEVVNAVNEYIESHPGRAILDLPGGRYRVVNAEVSKGNAIFTVAGKKSLETFSQQLDQCFYGDNPAGRQVTQVSPKELRDKYATVMVSKDGRAGGGVKHTGEIAGIYSNSTIRGTAHSIVSAGTEKGGKYLECFDTYLPKIYGKSGFTKVSSIDFNREYAPEGWDYDAMKQYHNGEPPIVMMMSDAEYEKHGKPEFKSFGSSDDAWDKATEYACR